MLRSFMFVISFCSLSQTSKARHSIERLLGRELTFAGTLAPVGPPGPSGAKHLMHSCILAPQGNHAVNQPHAINQSQSNHHPSALEATEAMRAEPEELRQFSEKTLRSGTAIRDSRIWRVERSFGTQGNMAHPGAGMVPWRGHLRARAPTPEGVTRAGARWSRSIDRAAFALVEGGWHE